MNSKLKKALIIIGILILLVALVIGWFIYNVQKGFQDLEFNMVIPEEPVRDFINDTFATLFHINR